MFLYQSFHPIPSYFPHYFASKSIIITIFAPEKSVINIKQPPFNTIFAYDLTMQVFSEEKRDDRMSSRIYYIH